MTSIMPRTQTPTDLRFEQPIRVAIVDEFPAHVMGLAQTIDRSPSLEVVATASSGAALLQRITETAPDVVIIEPWMRSGDGVACITRIAQEHPEIAIIALSRMWDDDHSAESRIAGAAAHLPKDTDLEDLPALVRQVVAGAEVRPAGQGATSRSSLLTEREREVLRLAARGQSNADIAHALFVTEQTVKFHLSNVYRKLGVHNRTEASHRAAQAGMLG